MQRTCAAKDPQQASFSAQCVLERGEPPRDGFVVGTTASGAGTVVPATVTLDYTFTYRDEAPLVRARGFHDAETAVAYFQQTYTPRYAAKKGAANRKIDRKEMQRQKRMRLARATKRKQEDALRYAATCACAAPCGCCEAWHAGLDRQFVVRGDEEFPYVVQGEITWKAFRRAHDGFTLGPIAVKVHWRRRDAQSRLVTWTRRTKAASASA